ncbi:MAG: response regulator transcription factor [Dehalococcoidales bacterium]
MEKDIRILVIDDHQVVREGIRHLLGQEEDMEFIGQAGNSEEALYQVEMFSPNIVLMDIKMPGMDGIELTRRVKRKRPNCNVIMLTLYDEYLTQAMEAGAKGYLLKDTKREELAQAVRQVHRGEVVISEGITSRTRFEYEAGPDKKALEGPDPTVEEIQLVLPPPVDASKLMRFTGRAEEALQSRVMQVVGSWQEGTILTIMLNRATSLVDILNMFGNMSEVEAIGEKPLTGEISPTLLKKAATIPRIKNRIRKTIFVTLEKN